MEVIFGVEGDLLNAKGDICDYIDGLTKDTRVKENFIILSAHGKVYAKEDKKLITNAYINAIQRHGSRIKFLGHPCIKDFEEHIDIEKVTKAANYCKIPLELNCSNLVYKKTNMDNLRKMLSLADRIYVNSDAHTLHELKEFRKIGFDFLREEGYIK